MNTKSIVVLVVLVVSALAGAFLKMDIKCSVGDQAVEAVAE